MSSAADRALALARATAGAVVDPELPCLTLDDLGVLGGVDVSAAGRVRVTITPTFLGCPATAVIRRDVDAALPTRSASRRRNTDCPPGSASRSNARAPAASATTRCANSPSATTSDVLAVDFDG
ncbi:MAG TPA: iron-sulfur cluster assembly protein [Actinocrinis sp.]|nr:iron-sulfur cluster assembly protein [Actinocrinis sp.]